MSNFIAQKTIKKLTQSGISLITSKICVIGITFKENCPDVRNSKVPDIITELKEYGLNPDVFDPVASKETVNDAYNIKLQESLKSSYYDAIILAVPHTSINQNNFSNVFQSLKSDGPTVFIDVKSAVDKKNLEGKADLAYWRF